ncbi:unnamed protein product [Urochloa humidicola]
MPVSPPLLPPLPAPSLPTPRVRLRRAHLRARRWEQLRPRAEARLRALDLDRRHGRHARAALRGGSGFFSASSLSIDGARAAAERGRRGASSTSLVMRGGHQRDAVGCGSDPGKATLARRGPRPWHHGCDGSGCARSGAHFPRGTAVAPLRSSGPAMEGASRWHAAPAGSSCSAAALAWSSWR